MKLLLLSDLHCNETLARDLVRRAEKVDVVVGAGDFATCRRGLHETISWLRAISRPTVVVPGNAESYEELAEACRGWSAAHVLHGSAVEINGITFFGLGYAVPVTPFGAWSCDLSEAEAERLLAGCPEHAVLVSHSPPAGAADTDSSGRSLGSTALRAAIEKRRPLLVVCGHIHASWNTEATVAGVPVVNAGPHGVQWEMRGAPRFSARRVAARPDRR